MRGSRVCSTNLPQPSHVHTDIEHMRYIPSTDNAIDIDSIAAECMAAVRAQEPDLVELINECADILQDAMYGLHRMYNKQGRASDDEILSVASKVRQAKVLLV